ncbi:MAG: F-box protein [Waddliaceae bacterium]
MTQPTQLAFEELPLELNFNIFSYFDVQDLATCERVNKNWSIFCKHPTAWKNLNLGNVGLSLRPENIKQYLMNNAITSEKKLQATVQSFLKGISVYEKKRKRLTVVYPFKSHCYMHIDYGYIINCEDIEEKKYIFTKSLGEFQPKERIIYRSTHVHDTGDIDDHFILPMHGCSILEIRHNLPFKRMQEKKIERLLVKKHNTCRVKQIAYQTVILTLYLLFLSVITTSMEN